MKDSLWEEITDFQSYFEFDRFVEWLHNQVILGIAEELPVGKPCHGTALFQEKWFCHIDSNEIWRLVWPHSPFTGIFEKFKD